jgi:hypothetical protein
MNFVFPKQCAIEKQIHNSAHSTSISVAPPMVLWPSRSVFKKKMVFSPATGTFGAHNSFCCWICF